MPDKGSLYRFVPDEVLPPQQVWNNIAIALAGVEIQKAAVNQFSAGPALAAMEVNPPALVWENIKQELDKQLAPAIIPVRKTSRRLWPMAVAAAGVVGIILAIAIFVNKNEAKKIATNIASVITPGRIAADSQGFFTRPNKSPDSLPAQINSYTQARSLNGNTVKVSAKLLPMIEFFDDAAASNAVNDPVNTSKGTNTWKQKLIKWKAMVNNQAANTALINFADPIDLILFLQKKK